MLVDVTDNINHDIPRYFEAIVLLRSSLFGGVVFLRLDGGGLGS